MQVVFNKHVTSAVIKQRDDIRRLNKSFEAQLKAKGLTFNTPDVESFGETSSIADFYAECRGKFGEKAMTKLEKYAGKLV